MILVAVGASQFPFDRLLCTVDALDGEEEVVVQHGASEVRPTGARCVSFLPFAELKELVCEARVVVTHGGVGSILLALANGKRPYVVPRRRAFGETVDDHQLESSRRFAEAGLVTLVEDPESLAETIAHTNDHGAVRAHEGTSALATALRAEIAELAGPPRKEIQ